MKRGKTPVLTADQARELLDSIDVSTVVGLRDRALIAVMAYYSRASAPRSRCRNLLPHLPRDRHQGDLRQQRHARKRAGHGGA